MDLRIVDAIAISEPDCFLFELDEYVLGDHSLRVPSTPFADFWHCHLLQFGLVGVLLSIDGNTQIMITRLSVTHCN